jgi:hypothetical protein
MIELRQLQQLTCLESCTTGRLASHKQNAQAS